MAEQQTASDSEVVIDRLKSSISAEQALTAEARQRAEQERARADAAVAGKFAADEAAVANGLAATNTAIEANKSRLAEALAKGDHEAAANIQVEIGEALISRRTFESRKSRIEQAKTRATEEARTAAERPVTPQRIQYTPQTQEWLDRNGINGQPVGVDPNTGQPVFDPKFTKAYVANHAAQQVHGYRPDTPEYFAYLDRELGHANSVADVESPYSSAAATVEVDLSSDRIVKHDPPPTQQQQRPAPALPPSRSVPEIPRPGVRTGTVRLTPNEVEAARYSNPELWKTDQAAALREYAANKAALQAEGIM